VSRPERWSSAGARYSRPILRRSLAQLVGNLVALGLVWVAMALVARRGPWLALGLALPAAGFLVRLFIIMHDCGHGSFFRSRRANDAVGRLIGLLTLTPYGFWKRSHALHHATSGDLGRRGIGDIDTLTVREYRALRPARRLRYRLYRSPVVLLGVAPFYQFFIRHRLPLHLPSPRRAAGASVLANDLALAVGWGLGIGTLGAELFLAVYVPPLLLMATAGIWLFFVQHQFEHTYWSRSSDWSFLEASLCGSSFYDLPRPLGWLTGNVGLHHVHHLCPRIPNYRLRPFLDAHPELRSLNRLTLRSSLGCARLALWDEELGRLVRFAEG
jgi:omega-6 fatty acid desaturase (delta-12 desaturase)